MTSAEASPNPYNDLDLEQSVALLATLRERYWNTADYLASIALDKADIHSHIQQLMWEIPE